MSKVILFELHAFHHSSLIEVAPPTIKANCENEYAAAIQLVKHYGWMAPDLFYIPRTHFKDIVGYK
jgi:hypothetical protein